MNAIVAVDEKWGIGKDGGLLCHLPGDLKYFKEKTLGKTIIMGRKTIESLPGGKPLPGRETLLLSSTKGMSLGEIFSAISGVNPEDVFVCGGESVYRTLLNFCDTVYVTKIEGDFGANRFFPDMDRLVKVGDAKLISESERFEENGIGYRFLVYKK